MAAIGRVLLDSSFAVALAFDSDERHMQAIAWEQRIRIDRIRLVVTHAVCLEIGNGFSRARARSFGIAFLMRMESDPHVDIVPLSADLFRRALDLYRSRPDKEWGLTDCVSFVVMRDLGLTDALTADRHFEQAGFTALLREG